MTKEKPGFYFPDGEPKVGEIKKATYVAADGTRHEGEVEGVDNSEWKDKFPKT